MKINFDSLTRNETQRNSQQYLMNSFSLDSLPAKQQISTYSLLTQDTTPKINHSIRKNAEEVKNILQFHLEQALRNEESKGQPFFVRKKQSVDIKELTERIYKSPHCNKKYCKQYQFQKMNRQIMELFQTKRQFKANKTYQTFNEDQLNVYERLHNHSKIIAIKKLQKAKIPVFPQNEYVNRKKSVYLKNYIPFYQRLQSIVSKSQEKKQFLQNNPQLSFNQSQPFFAPQFIKSKYDDVKSRYSKDLSNSRQGVSFKGLTSSLNTSFQSISSLDKSVQLVNDIEQYFFNRMECIFVNREQGQIEITQQNIKLLSAIEFKIMQDFVIGLETNPISAELFIDRLQAYYQKLNFRDKQELRIHQTKLKKYSKKAQKQRNSSFKQQKTQRQSKKESVENRKYQKQLLYV